jgi:glycosyltransferase involved in cell wall biosynthesis
LEIRSENLTTVATIGSELRDLATGSLLLPTVVVCIPAYNEETRIGWVVREARKFAQHVIVCDDGSADSTAAEATANGAFVIRHDRNEGKGAALRTLLGVARKLAPDVIITLDADRQHDPSDIPKLVTPILDGSADVVIGSRFGNGNKIPIYRKVGNSILTTLTNMTAKTSIQDTQSGFRAYSSKVISSIIINRNGMGVDSELLITVAKRGFRIEETNVSVKYEGETSTFNPLSHTFRVVWSLIRTLPENRSIRFSKRLLALLFLGPVVGVGYFFGIAMPSVPPLVFASWIIGIGTLAVVVATITDRRIRHFFKETDK